MLIEIRRAGFDGQRGTRYVSAVQLADRMVVTPLYASKRAGAGAGVCDWRAAGGSTLATARRLMLAELPHELCNFRVRLLVLLLEGASYLLGQKTAQRAVIGLSLFDLG